MEAPVIEIFSSFQGEGLLIGERQIFLRFAGCNLNCSYCDTELSKNKNNGTLMSVDEVINEINKLKTPDVNTISFTGGEPLLYPDFINEVMEKTDLNSLIETNGTLLENLSKINTLDWASVDIKLPEHFKDNSSSEIIEKEIQFIKLLIEKETKIYCKMVVLPSTNLLTIERIIKKISDNLPTNHDIPLIIQPVSPLNQWESTDILFELSQLVGKYMKVYTIPQIHKILNIE